MNHQPQTQPHTVAVDLAGVTLMGDLALPSGSQSIVAFAHGSGSSRLSRRNRFVAQTLNQAGIATLLFDLLTAKEETIDERTHHLRFNIDLLAQRLTGTVDWLGAQPSTQSLPIGLFGASTGAAAALVTAAQRPKVVNAVVSRGGRPDLAADILPQVQAPTLLIVGGDDTQVIDLNRYAASQLQAPHQITIVPAATHLFEEPGKLEEVARLACDWFQTHLSKPQ